MNSSVSKCPCALPWGNNLSMSLKGRDAVWTKNDFMLKSGMNFAGSITVIGGSTDLCKPINIWRSRNPNDANAVWTHSVVLPTPGYDKMQVNNDGDKWTCNGIGETPVVCHSTTSSSVTIGTATSSSSSSSTTTTTTIPSTTSSSSSSSSSSSTSSSSVIGSDVSTESVVPDALSSVFPLQHSGSTYFDFT